MTVIRKNQAIVDAAMRAREKEAARRAREQAFRQRSDPLQGKLLRGEITQEQFDAIAAQIRADFPYPTQGENK